MKKKLSDEALNKLNQTITQHAEHLHPQLQCADAIDGFFTGIFYAPEPIAEYQWLHILYDNREPHPDLDAQLTEYFEYVRWLVQQKQETHSPQLAKACQAPPTITAICRWCEGFMLSAQCWTFNGFSISSDILTDALHPIRNFGSPALQTHFLTKDHDLLQMSAILIPSVLRQLRTKLLKALPPQKPIVRDGPKPGRNDPCCCGSGKKYKKCCMR
jgi:uncharacterized protein YecA (UPF0149 family)